MKQKDCSLLKVWDTGIYKDVGNVIGKPNERITVKQQGKWSISVGEVPLPNTGGCMGTLPLQNTGGYINTTM